MGRRNLHHLEGCTQIPAVLLLVVSSWGQIGSKHTQSAGSAGQQTPSFQCLGAGGTGIDPATCGFGVCFPLSIGVHIRLSAPNFRPNFCQSVHSCPWLCARVGVTVAVNRPDSANLRPDRGESNSSKRVHYPSSRFIVLVDVRISHHHRAVVGRRVSSTLASQLASGSFLSTTEIILRAHRVKPHRLAARTDAPQYTPGSPVVRIARTTQRTPGVRMAFTCFTSAR
jgi:hypothetical protein